MVLRGYPMLTTSVRHTFVPTNGSNGTTYTKDSPTWKRKDTSAHLRSFNLSTDYFQQQIGTKGNELKGRQTRGLKTMPLKIIVVTEITVHGEEFPSLGYLKTMAWKMEKTALCNPIGGKHDQRTELSRRPKLIQYK